MKNKSLNKHYPALVAGFLLLSCTLNKQQDPLEQLRNEIKILQPRLMSASDAAMLIEKSEAAYIPNLTLSTSIIEKYLNGDTLKFLSNNIQAAGLMGLYTADVVYELAFSKKEDAFESYTSAQLIANELGMGDIYVTNLISRYESTEFSIDSMITEMDRALTRINKNLTDTDRTRLLLAYMTGNYIEKQYYIHATIQSYKTQSIEPQQKLLLAKEFILITLSQEQSIHVLIDLIEKNSYATDKGYFLAELKVLRDDFTKIAPLSANIDELTPADIFENPDFDAVFNQLETIRAMITEGIND
jgi:hypothetical protein